MSTILQRASVFAIKRETTAGEFVEPTAGADAIPLKSGFSMEFTTEELSNDELLNDIGATKTLAGKETIPGVHPAYLKTSETAGVEPEVGLLYESCLGAKSVASTEYDTAAGSTVSVINVGAGEGATFEVGEAVMVKDSANGYSIRGIQSIASDALTLNFQLPGAPASGVNLGKAVLYKPASSGHPSFTSWLYNGNGGALQVAAGCRVSGINMTFNSGEQAEVEFSYEGAKYYFNPIIINSSTKYFDWTDDDGTFAASIAEGIYASPIEVARALQAAIEAQASTETITVTYSNTTGKFTIATSTSAVLSLLWNTGANTANTIGAKIGFSTAADDSGFLTYTSDNATDLDFPYTPDYDDASNIVVKEAELLMGDSTDYLCRCASTVTINIGTPVTDVDCICAEGGVQEKLIISREVTMTAEMVLNQYDLILFDKLKNNSSLRAMVNVGPKSGGNWVPGKCVSVILGNASVTQHTLTGDDFVVVNVTLKGFVTSDIKDVYINMI